jgi:polysaccharide deacetylase family protein (PEP-CTERM system associated)
MNILTFDIEEWFHLLDNPSTKTEQQWNNFESRIHTGMETIYQCIDSANVSATFFVVGWMAKKHPEVIREITDRGFEVGSHTYLHQLVYEQDRKTFYRDVERSIKTLEDCTGKKVTSFRAPGFSITEKNKWSFEVLYELGIEIDSSVFPAGRSHGGFPEYGVAKPSVLQYNGARLKEFPINTHLVFNKSIIFSGGGYFRLFPYEVIKRWTQKSDYVMSYFHPRDFDPTQPMISGLSAQRKFKSYVGLKTAEKKINSWLSDFEFIDIATANTIVDWKKAKVIQL